MAVLSGCTKKPSPSPDAAATGRPYSVYGKTYYPLLTVDEYEEQGIASWYGTEFHGRKTSSGEPYDMNAPTAAHRILPFGSVAEVTNRTNGKKTVVTINDRGPFVKDRIIDLSYRGAQELDMVGPGTAPVTITVVGIDNRYTQPLPSGAPAYDPWSGTFAVQVGAFSTEETARALKEKLSGLYEQAYILRFEQKNKTLYRVRVGPFETLKETIKVQKQLAAAGYGNTFMVAE
jgi:rare lipoprotein A